MEINNYDINSKGINIELSIFYDTCLSQIYFKENFIEYSEGYAYVDFGNIKMSEFRRQHDIVKFRSFGYCQGDVACIYINKTLLKKAWGVKKIDIEALKKEIHHYLWDAPLCFCLKINNKLENRDIELYQYDIFNSEYVYYDKDDTIAALKKHLTETEINEVVNLLPEEVEYL